MYISRYKYFQVGNTWNFKSNLNKHLFGRHINGISFANVVFVKYNFCYVRLILIEKDLSRF